MRRERGPVPEAGASRLRLQTIVRLRWIAVAGQSVTVIGVHVGLGFELPIGLCMTVVALSAWLNVILRVRYPASHRLKTTHATAMLGYDTLQLAALLYLTGGLQNPFAFLILVPVTVSASTQPPRFTIALGILAFVIASLLTVYHLPLPWYPGEFLALPLVYIVGVWAAVVSGMVFMALYAWRIAKEARQMSDALAATEMVLAREQKLSALDGLAAAAAHGLGTPLSTIAVVAKELLRELPDGSPQREDVALLHAQAQRCREILSTLSARDEEPDSMLARQPLTHLIEEAVAPHRALGVAITVEAGPGGRARDGQQVAEPVGQRSPGVVYGLGNLIENAVDFARDHVSVVAAWDGEEVRVRIADDGPGIPAPVLEHLGEPYITTRADHADPTVQDTVGLGLGYFIAKTLLERSGARLEIENRSEPHRGTLVTVTWPRAVFDGAPAEYPQAAQ